MNKESIYKALGLFIEAIRPYIVSKLVVQAGDKWPAWFVESLSPQQRDNWNNSLRSGAAPVNLIDYHHLKGFSLRYKDLLKEDFGQDTNKLPTWLEEIAEVRHKCNHYQEVEERDIRRAFDNMIDMAGKLKQKELKADLEKIQKGETAVKPIALGGGTPAGGVMLPWFKNVTPHLDIRSGTLDESVFAANLSEVALGYGRTVYQEPSLFFSKTYFTSGLKNIARRVMKGLNGEEDAENRVISLQTGFGGGKTHTLISLYHLANSPGRLTTFTGSTELLAYIGKPSFEKAAIAVFTNSTNDPTQGRKVNDTLTIRTIWGEIAWQLAGEEGYALIRANDENRTSPKGLFKKVLALASPSLILIDELADYCVTASGIQVGGSTLSDQTISFVQELSEAISGTNRCVLVATLPASVQEVANSEKASGILGSLANRLGRVGADTKPVADEEIFEVIRRRLFEDLGSNEIIDTVVSRYASMYGELKSGLPEHVVRSEYKDKLRKAYPFHPELIDIFRIKWASHHDFQRTRGVLRLLASIVTDLWKRQGSLTGSHPLIHTSDIKFANLDALSGQLKKLYGNGYDAVIHADVSGSSSNAFKIDRSTREFGDYDLAEGISSTILLGSFGSAGANKGTSVAELKLCCIKPDSFNHNNIHAVLDLLEGNAHYLYYSTSGQKRYWFHTKPNINILINQAKQDISKEAIEVEIIRRIKEKERSVALFNMIVNPSEDIPEQQRPTLVILSPRYVVTPGDINGITKPLIEKLATKKGNSDRNYRNTMLFLVCSEIGIGKLEADIRDYLACQKIGDEYKGQLEAEQRNDIERKKGEASKGADSSLVTAYAMLIKYSVKKGIDKLAIKQYKDSLDKQINEVIAPLLKEEEWLLEAIGLGTLRSNNLLPTAEQAIKVKDIYEAFIRFDDKPMITGTDALQKSLLRYCSNGDFCIATGDGSTFTRFYFQETVPFFELTDATYWLVDKTLKPKPELLTPQPISETGPSVLPIVEDKGITKLNPSDVDTDAIKSFKAITISGKVPLERYTELFNYFITPFAMNGNKLEIEVTFKIHSTAASPLDETKQTYKSAKEAAKQLRLDFREE